MDPRLHPATRRIAHVSLAGRTDLPLTTGEEMALARPLTDLLASPGGARERQLVLGAGFVVVDRTADHAFGFAIRDGYCGWLPETALGRPPRPTHWVATPGTHLYEGPRVQNPDLAALPMGARLEVTAITGAWAETPAGYVPTSHLMALVQHHMDPVAVAEMFLHTPYLWGGNSRAGLDCSGLVQVAFHACGLACPGDSDLQEGLGEEIGPEASLRRGDLLFWRGHVAMVVDETRMIHANGHTMSVAYEPIAQGVARILAQGGGPVTHRRRP